MEAPQNITELRRFLGMVNQLGKFLPNLATATERLCGLLSTGSSWHWGQPQRHAFNEIKRMLSSSPVLSLYDPNLPTKVTADSSSYRLGAVVTQQQPDGRWSPVVYTSRALTPTETVCTNRKRSSSSYMGQYQVPRLLNWNNLHTQDRSQTIGSLA